MIILVRPKLFNNNFSGMALWPFVVLKHQSLKKDSVFLNHEQIHLRQQAELLVVFFYLWYGLEFAVRFIQYGNKYSAYKNISFEREAYFHEGERDYLKKRIAFGFLKFL